MKVTQDSKNVVAAGANFRCGCVILLKYEVGPHPAGWGCHITRSPLHGATRMCMIWMPSRGNPELCKCLAYRSRLCKCDGLLEQTARSKCASVLHLNTVGQGWHHCAGWGLCSGILERMPDVDVQVLCTRLLLGTVGFHSAG